MKNTDTDSNSSNSSDQNNSDSWWEQMITRREANLRLAKLGAMAALLSASGVLQGCDDDDDIDSDSLDLQKSDGWNVGSTDKSLVLNGRSKSDSLESLSWTKYLNPVELLKAYEPKNPEAKKYVVATLVQSLSQSSLKSQIAPIITKEMREAYSRGLGMKELLSKSEKPDSIALTIDLTGPESVAFGAALADQADLILTFDNFPHPLAVVPSHETLGALLYYADEVAKKRESRKNNSPVALLLDSKRLNAFNNPDTEFDNRYVAKIPTADNLNSLQVKSILYITPDQSRTVELDDLNDDFASFKEKNISVTLLPATEFKPYQKVEPSKEELAQLPRLKDTSQVSTKNAAAMNAASTQSVIPVQSAYYYGGNPFFTPWFFFHYPMFYPSPFYYPNYNRGYYATSYRTSRIGSNTYSPSYSPARRPTLFSSRTTGGGSGIGKTKPTGFGRVSTRSSGGTSSSSGFRSRLRSSSSSRSGSWGRSGGRSSS